MSASNWNAFRDEAPELARRAVELFEASGVVLLGTVRREGSPRISPVEPLFLDPELYLGMMWRSFKALDLLRDPRCTIHSSIADRLAPQGELKLHARCIQVRDLAERERYRVALREKIGWAPEEPRFHLFAVRAIESAALFVDAESARTVTRWRAGRGVERFVQRP